MPTLLSFFLCNWMMIALQRVVPGTLLAVLMQVPAAAAQPSDKQGEASTARPRDPAQIFATTCGWCHHKGGREAGKGPQLMGTSASDGEIIYRIKMGKAGYMPAFGTAFSEEEITALVSYIRNLKPR
jgi:mono/diheme cytochrome c family protein